MIRSACCSNCGTRVEVQTYTGVEKVLCPGCQKIEDEKELRAIADCDKCETRVCERGEK